MKDFYSLMQYCGISEKVRECMKNNPDETDYVAEYKMLHEIKRRTYRIDSIFIHGPAGSGKTTRACRILCQLIQNEEVSRWSVEWENRYFSPADQFYKPDYEPFYCMQFIRLNGLFRKIKQTFDSNWSGMSEYDTLQQYLECDLLILDDIGVEMATPWNYQTLHTVLDERDDNFLPIIFTSNLSPDELAEKWNDKRLVSRVLGMCKNHVVEMNGKDRRL